MIVLILPTNLFIDKFYNKIVLLVIILVDKYKMK